MLCQCLSTLVSAFVLSRCSAGVFRKGAKSMLVAVCISKVALISDYISDWYMLCADHAEEAVYSDCRLGALLGVL